MNLIEKTNTVIIHYGCSGFEEPEHIIYWIGAVYFKDNEKTYFFEDGEETEMINRLKEFVDSNQEKTFIHWSMNSPNFGFTPIEQRYKKIMHSELSLSPTKQCDLSEFLKEKYGVEYISRVGGRLNNLAELNGFSGYQKTKEVIKKHEATKRLELIFSIYQAETQGKLKVLNTLDTDNPYPLLFISGEIYSKFIEYTSNHIIDYYLDYSYLKKRLENDQLIYRVKDNEFMRIVYEDKKITERDYKDYSDKHKLVSLKKSSNANRENNFNNIFCS